MNNITNYKRKSNGKIKILKALNKARRKELRKELRKTQIQRIGCMFHKQNNIYGQYLVQESKDIDRTIKSLEKILIQETP